MINDFKLNKKNIWNSSEDLMRLLPNQNIFSLKGSIDRYGFCFILSDICGLKKPKRTFAEWVHAWHWHENLTAELMGLHLLNHTVPTIVTNKKEYDGLKKEGFQKVIIGGLPIAYVKQQHNYRNEQALLAMPPHTNDVTEFNNSQDQYLDYLETLKGDFDGIYVCIVYSDWEGPLHKAAKKRGLNVIQGTRPDDANSLIRMRAIFDAFNYVTSNCIGSHFVYAQFAKCKFSFSGPVYSFDEEAIVGRNKIKKYSQTYVNQLIENRSEKYLRSRFGNYFVDKPQYGICNSSFARSEVGYDNILNKSQILDAVGWSIKGKLIGYIRGGLNKTNNFLYSK